MEKFQCIKLGCPTVLPPDEWLAHIQSEHDIQLADRVEITVKTVLKESTSSSRIESRTDSDRPTALLLERENKQTSEQSAPANSESLSPSVETSETPDVPKTLEEFWADTLAVLLEPPTETERASSYVSHVNYTRFTRADDSTTAAIYEIAQGYYSALHPPKKTSLVEMATTENERKAYAAIEERLKALEPTCDVKVFVDQEATDAFLIVVLRDTCNAHDYKKNEIYVTQKGSKKMRDRRGVQGNYFCLHGYHYRLATKAEHLAWAIETYFREH